MRENNKKITFWALIGLFFSWVIYASFFVRHGLSLTDPGLICSQAWRFSLGDIPFRDVLCLPIGLSDYLLSIVLRVYPTCGLLGLRIAWAVILLISILTAYIIISRFYSAKVVFWAMLCSLSIFAMYGVNLPNYKNMPEMFFIFSIAFLILAFNTAFKRKAVMYSIIAGIAAFLAAFCTVTFLGIIGVALIASFLALLIRSNIRFRILRSSTVFGITFFVSLAIFIFCLHSLGLVINDFLVYSKVYSTYPSIINGIFGRGSIWLLKSMPLVIMCLFFALMVAFWPPKKLTVLKYFYQLAVIFLFAWFFLRLIPFPPYFIYTYSYVLLGIGIIISWIGVYRENDEGLKSKNQLKIILLLLAAFLQWLSTVYSANGIYASHKGMLLSLPLSIVVSYELGGYLKNQFKLNPKSILSYRAIIIMFAIIMGIYGFCFKLKHPYQDSPDRSRLSVPFKTIKLRGILSTHKHVEAVDRLVEFISPLIKKGDYMLVYPNLPMLYFLTDARPATRVTWFLYITKPLDKIAVEDLKKNKPKIVIRTHQYMCANDWPSVKLTLDSPGSEVFFVNHYVKENYKLINKIGAFEILVPKDKYINEEFEKHKVNILGQVFYTKNKREKLKPINFKSEKVWNFSLRKKDTNIEFCKIYNQAKDSDFSFKIRYYPENLKGFSNFGLNFNFLDKEGSTLGALSYVLYGSNDHYYPVNEIIDGKVFATYVINPVEKKWKDLKVDSVIADYEKIAYKLQGRLYDELGVEKVKVSISSRGSEREDSFMSVYLANLEMNPKKIDYSQIDKLTSQIYPSVYRKHGVTLFHKRYFVADAVLKRCIRDFQNQKVINFFEPRNEGQLIFSKEYQDIANSDFSLVVKYFPESIQGISKFSFIFQLLDPYGKDLGMLTYVLYGTTDHYCRVNEKFEERVYATYIINPVEKEWKTLKVDSIINDYNAIATRLEGKLWDELNVEKIKVAINSWSAEGGTISVYVKGLEVKREKH